MFAEKHLKGHEYGKGYIWSGMFLGRGGGVRCDTGVTATAVGYEGGKLERPSYRDVCTDSTGMLKWSSWISIPQR